ncbi:MoaD/ThiS family protein [Rhizobium sp. C4]|uniref:MoaD/ThiS family protein n=1 Tax=Rhizobium sp. C4 TaxID=1349800 RepID=UPI001E5B8C37|nr:MoaD/ThiS family protein [Rhizobium sp. C4]MCD2173113.1 MoaD/ThiS family protein [Rhizobium sp. C4]
MTEPSAASCEVVLPDALLRLYPEAERRLTVAAADVGALIDALDQRWPGMGACLKDSRPSVRKHISIMIDGERTALETKIVPGATVFVLTAVSGG